MLVIKVAHNFFLSKLLVENEAVVERVDAHFISRHECEELRNDVFNLALNLYHMGKHKP